MAKKATTKKTEAEADSGVPMRVYEVGYLLSPSVTDDGLPVAVGKLKELITKASGTVIAEGAPEYIDLAYTMTREIENKQIRFDSAYFGWIKFECAPGNIHIVKEALDLDITIIRHLIIETVRDNTIISKKPLSKMLRKNGRGGDKAPAEKEGGETVVAEGEEVSVASIEEAPVDAVAEPVAETEIA